LKASDPKDQAQRETHKNAMAHAPNNLMGWAMVLAVIKLEKHE
jgi:hypothetical protein